MLYSQVDIIFKGKHSGVNFDFLNDLLHGSKEVSLNYSDIYSVLSSADIHEILDVFRSNNYVDLIISTQCLVIKGIDIPGIFIDLTRNEDELELLFFFDVKDFVIGTYKKRVDELEKWARHFAADYGFDYFVCQMDNGNEEEYYFDSNGIGPFYKMIEE